MLTISFSTETKYDIVFPKDPFEELKNSIPKGTNVVIITDTNVEKLFGNQIEEALDEFDFSLLHFDPGEEQKSMKTVLDFVHVMQGIGYSRKNTILVTLGGGIVGDVGGFTASLYMRGIPYIQMPTTLLAMVDSSIGGKTGVNTEYGKNLLGAFYHPQKIIASPYFLKTLPETEIRNGLGEMVKHAVLDGEEHITKLQKNIQKILNRDSEICISMIKKSIQVKEYHVEKDAREHGIRAFLNFGHTIGHAIEKASRFTIPHGYAIAIGMVLEARIAEKELGFTGTEKIVELLKTAGLPTELPENLDHKELCEYMTHDKKNEGGKISYALPKDFGEMKICSFDEPILM